MTETFLQQMWESRTHLIGISQFRDYFTNSPNLRMHTEHISGVWPKIAETGDTQITSALVGQWRLETGFRWILAVG